MLCPRCYQGANVVEKDESWSCPSCRIFFTQATQVVRPILVDSIWVERATGALFRVVEAEGDTFDPSVPIRYRTDIHAGPTQVMLSGDFRFYFRARDPLGKSPIIPPCKPREEWESEAGVTYVVLGVDPKEGIVHVTPASGSNVTFKMRGLDFMEQFRKVHRRSDFDRLLNDALV